jgi:hypothetical protein
MQINWRGKVYGKGSYSIVSRAMVLTLWRLGYDVVVEELFPDDWQRETIAFIGERNAAALNAICVR